MSCFRKGLRVAAILFLLIPLFLPSCTAPAAFAGNLLAFRDAPSAFSAVFLPPERETAGESDSAAPALNAVRCSGMWDGNTVTLTVTEPERSRGTTVVWQPNDVQQQGSVTLSGGGNPIPLSESAAASLDAVFRVLLTEDGDAHRSSDGLSTAVVTPSGTLTLDGSSLPAAVTVSALGKSPRTVEFIWGEPSESPESSNSNQKTSLKTP